MTTTTEFEALAILYSRMYQMARTADSKSRPRKLALLNVFEERMEKAGYPPEEIRKIARHALRDLLRAGYCREHLRWIRGNE
jgi:hypothetical protein